MNYGMQATEMNINNLQNKIWYVIKQDESVNDNSNLIINSNDIYEIKINDIIKLGRVKYAISEIKLNNHLKTLEKDVQQPVFDLIYDYK
jgi:hypothetical protein